jgi:hypothetical protein
MKNLLRKLITGTIFGLILYIFMFYTVAASASQNGIPDITVDKTVSRFANTDLNTVEYVDNLSPSDNKFKAGDSISFKFRIKNNTNEAAPNARLEDSVPAYVEPQNGVYGWDNASRMIRIAVGTLNPGEEKVYIIPMRVVSQDQLPASPDMLCVVNRVLAACDQASPRHPPGLLRPPQHRAPPPRLRLLRYRKPRSCRKPAPPGAFS